MLTKQPLLKNGRDCFTAGWEGFEPMPAGDFTRKPFFLFYHEFLPPHLANEFWMHKS
jgi:hypothetical protein